MTIQEQGQLPPEDQSIEIELEAEEAEGVEDNEGDNGNEADSESDSKADPAKAGKRTWVQFDKPEQQKAYNDLYKQVKMSDTRNSFLMDANTKLLSRLEEVESRFAQTDQAEAERILMERLKEARQSGDDDQEIKVLNELVGFHAERKKNKDKQPAVKPSNFADDALVHDAQALFTETDASGNLAHPWILQTHPEHQQYLRMAAIVAAEVNAETGDIDLPTIIERVEERMSKKATGGKTQTQRRAPDPMRSDLTNRQPERKLKLSAAEVSIANKLGISPEAYAKHKG